MVSPPAEIIDKFSLIDYHTAMAQKQKSSQKTSVRRRIFLANIVLLIGIVGLTVYDYSIGENIFDHSTRERVLAEQAPTPTPTPTFTPQLP